MDIRNNIGFAIVTYKERYSECLSFQTLVESFKASERQGDNLLIFIFDNTPGVEIEEKEINYEDNVGIKFFSKGQNHGISYAYNFLAEKMSNFGLSWIALLDQDTKLPIKYYQKYIIIQNDVLFFCPKVYVGNVLTSPSYYINYRSSLLNIDLKNKLKFDKISCINSGLLINLSLFNKVGGYNQNIFLDFCDHDFVQKIKNFGLKEIGVLDVGLDQAFSYRLNNKRQAIERYKIFVKDLMAYRKNKNVFLISLMVDIPHLLKLIFKHRSFKFLSIRLNS